MDELARAVEQVADALERRGVEAVLAMRVAWPSSEDAVVARLEGALERDLDGLLRRIGALRKPEARRAASARLARRYRYLAQQLGSLARRVQEAQGHERALREIPSRESLDAQAFARETEVDPRRLHRIQLQQAEIRAQVRIEQIEATLLDYDPRERIAALRAQSDRLELERLLLIEASGEPRRGLDLEIEAARAALAGQHERAGRLRAEAQRRYRQFVVLSKHAALAPLRPLAERATAGERVDASWVPDALADELERLARWAEGRTVFVAGCTHDGDEAAVGAALLARGAHLERPLLFVAAPRWVDRAPDVLRELRALFGEVSLLRSEAPSARPDAVVVNVSGLLKSIYGLAHGAFIGGGRSAVRDHNFGEPLAHGIPTYTTPHRQWGPERWALLRAHAPELVHVVADDTLEDMARDFCERVSTGQAERDRRARAATFLALVRRVEGDALQALRGLGEERIAWLETLRAAGDDEEPWRRCPYRRELLELGLLVGPGITQLPAYEGTIAPATVTGVTKYLLDQLADASPR